jgi:serine protease AprX
MGALRLGATVVANRRASWTVSVLAGAAALTTTMFALPGPAQAGLLPSAPTATYIVSDPSGAPGAASTVLGALGVVGAGVGMNLSFDNAATSQLTQAQASLLQLLPGIVVTPDITVSVQSTTTASSGRAPAAVYPEQTGASTLWAQGDTGAGVNVAVLDTGIDPLADFSGRLVAGVDLSGGGNPFQDSYGHGTFVSGLIAGDGASSDGTYVGEAPGAGLVSIRVAGASGQTDLATLIEGVGWAIANRIPDNIRVLNLSLGAIPTESTTLNPLDQIVEKAWESGITVVASAGNAGPFNGTILSPGDDPLVITVGAIDDQGSTNPSGDTMTAFSSVGPTNPDGWIKPDLVASGRSVVSLRAPGSTIDTEYPSARIGTGNFVGSGTSFSAAVVSGAAALLLSAHPTYTPDMVKAALLGNTMPGPVGNPFVDGHGELNVEAAVDSAPMNLVQIPPLLPTLMGATVSLSAVFATSTWNPQLWSGLTLNGSSWNGSSWNGSSWNGSSWNGTVWSGSSWNGSSWNGSSWNGSSWNGSSWNGSSWNGSSWNGSSWNGSSWN